ncbi:MAG: hypothetical protein QME12_06090 [Nanoarchaeota archaeon]|nr:hypothetical protein [Nanoarchaeota archaeon]
MKEPDWKRWVEDKQLCKRALQAYIKRRALRKPLLTADIYFRKARHNLDFANWLKDKHKDEIPMLFGNDRFYDWCISAYYYAIYHAALSLISARSYSSKSHNATLCATIWFYYHQQKHLEKGDIELIGTAVNKGDIRLIAETKSIRERASYDASANFEFVLVERAKRNAVYFLNKVRDILGIKVV